LRRCRAAASWSQRNRARLDRIFGVRDPWIDEQCSEDWTYGEAEAAWHAAADHLRAHGLFSSWQIPASVRVAWYCRRCPCRCRREAA
jgi:peptidoglycan/xylan/chitin deacetylase (PgdA/CDA1 family)